ncbi:MAG: prenyltransferase/squalene oxidase repeat-containing protein, partial [Planctomycetota bacterium]
MAGFQAAKWISLCLVFVLCGATLSQEPADDSLEARKDAAVKKGVQWLKKQQKPNGCIGGAKDNPTYRPGVEYRYEAGMTALSVLALLHSGVRVTDSVVRKGYGFVLAEADKRQLANYELGVALMMIEAYYASKKGKIENKTPTAVRREREKKGRKFKEPRYTPSSSVKAVISKMVRQLLQKQTPRGGWRYGANFGHVGSDEDISQTQIVLLGLKSATRLGSEVKPVVFERAMRYILGMQEKDGPVVPRPGGPEYKPGDRMTYASTGKDRARGWPYIAEGSKPIEEMVSGGMTCAGIGGLLIIKSELDKQMSSDERKRLEQAVYDGFAWLYLNWQVEHNPGVEGLWREHYYLY